MHFTCQPSKVVDGSFSYKLQQALWLQKYGMVCREISPGTRLPWTKDENEESFQMLLMTKGCHASLRTDRPSQLPIS